MKFTRVIAVTLVAAAIGATSAGAQSLRSPAAATPAEFPPASFQGKQYVDSRGCIFIRAGIDGNVTWVPRVSRDRKQVCGYQPTLAGSTAAAAPAQTRAPAPVEITLAPSQQPAAPAPKPLPQAVTTRPAPTLAPTAPAPRMVRRPAPAPVVVMQPKRTEIAPRRDMPAQQGGPCANASTFSQQYINRGPGVRCGPQAEPPVTYGQGWGPQSSIYDPNARAVPRHVYERRRNTTNVSIPAGYRPVWKDDRLNPHRAERRLTAAIPRQVQGPPTGYVPVVRDDDRLNPYRAGRTPAGDAQTDQIWTRTVPRVLVQVPIDRPVVVVPAEVAKSPAERGPKPILRLSTRSEPVRRTQDVSSR
ncbi:SPOR domain-containing protein [Pseudodonghicola flavimaris]|uniref:SPOR domain-containing protein n=1 Tax=Pseudodonghicola flavimaris TaxID=3050036 RepID=A0ABT7F5S8_9RHOB|nr:SPOR domain-containing protein [Pseudodonghicola flavimaris]MDK3019975.1 SPOR domain-containing protein [Pseudodonghicola flavimaris]